MYELFLKGGPLMYPLLICSLISLTITIERIMFWIREKKRCDSERLKDILNDVETGNLDRALSLGKGSRDSIIRVICCGLAHHDFSLLSALEMAAADEIERMKRGLSILDTIITMAPLLGILGTVLGIIESFHFLGVAGVEDPRAVVGGIAQALITTAAGLSVALFTLVPFNYFVSKVKKAARLMEKYTTGIEIVYQKGKNSREVK